jgi:hypothetical protein
MSARCPTAILGPCQSLACAAGGSVPDTGPPLAEIQRIQRLERAFVQVVVALGLDRRNKSAAGQMIAAGVSRPSCATIAAGVSRPSCATDDDFTRNLTCPIAYGHAARALERDRIGPNSPGRDPRMQLGRLTEWVTAEMGGDREMGEAIAVRGSVPAC